MKKAIAALMLLIILSSSTVIAQDYRLYPVPNPPEYQKTMAPQEVWIYDSTVRMTPEGYVFSAKVKTFFFAGLDEDENRIPYKYQKDRNVPVYQDDPSSFEILDEVFTGTAFIKIGVDDNIIARTKFKVTGGLDGDKKAGEKDGIIEFAPIKRELSLLPTMYRISAEIDPGNQYQKVKVGEKTYTLKDLIWVDKEERTRVNGSDTVKIIRDDPRKALEISVDAFIMVKIDEKGRIDTFKEGAINYYESAILNASHVDDYEKQVDDIKEKMKTEQDPGKFSNLEVTYFKLLDDLSKCKFWKTDSVNKALKKALAEAKPLERGFKQAVHTFDRQAKIAIVGVLDKIYSFYYEVYYTSFGCLPDWTTKKKEKMQELDKKFKISSYLKKGKPGIKVEKGEWKRDKWLENLNDNWLVQIDNIKKDFRKIYGKAMLDPKADEKDPNYWGMLEDGTRTYWEPVFKTGYEELYKYLFDQDLLTVTIRALANLLAEKHELGKMVKYPFVREGTLKADPNPTSAYSYASRLGQVKKTICRLIYSCAIPAEKLIDPDQLKDDNNKRKTEWACPNCHSKSAFRPREGKCPVCGTPMKEQKIEKDSGVTESGR